jgi:hypothetical protein
MNATNTFLRIGCATADGCQAKPGILKSAPQAAPQRPTIERGVRMSQLIDELAPDDN